MTSMQKQAVVEFLTPAFSFWTGRWEFFSFFLYRAGIEMLLTDCIFRISSLICQIRQNIEKLIVVASLSAPHSFIISSFLLDFCISLLSKALFPVASP